VPAVDSFFTGQARCISVKSKLWRTLCAPDHFDVAEACRADALAEGFERSLFRSEPDGKPRGRVARAARVFLLGFSE
jgi:hypothetical protein